MPMLKELNFNKLREAVLYCLSLYAEVVKTKMTGLPERFTKKKKKKEKEKMYHSNKSQLLKILILPLPYINS